MAEQRDIRINVPVLTRVEGEGALELEVKNGRIADLKLRIFEPPRLFEKFLEGRSYAEVPDIVARICGICPVAYQMSAAHAIEMAFGVEPTPWVREMRRLFYCGEWIESHALHIHLLALPDFLGFASAVEMAAKHPEEVKRGLKLQELGNSLVRLLGARSVHPVGVRAGGFFHAPAPEQVEKALRACKAALPEVAALVRWLAKLELPDDPQSFTSVGLRHPDEYAFNEGRIVSDNGLDLDITDFDSAFTECHIPHANALHCRLHDRPYLVGPLARINLNYGQLPQVVRDNLEATGFRFPSNNMFHSALARAVELHYALVEAVRIMENYSVPDSPYVEVKPRAGVGYGCTEAPRGILWHRYEFDEQGHVVSAIITPPTSQNQGRIEEDLRHSLEAMGLDKSDDEIRLRGEMVIRNYDPCISCATHFLRVNVKRG